MDFSASPPAGNAGRYAILLDLARALTPTMGPALLFPAAHAHVARVLPASSFLASLHVGGLGLRPIFQAGRGGGCEAFCRRALERLRAGEHVLETGGAEAHDSYLAAPLLRDDRLLGCLAVERIGGRPFDEEDAAFLEAVARLAAVALDGAWLSLEAQRRSDEIERLDAIARDLGASLDLEEVVQHIADHAERLVEKPVVVWLVEGDQARATARAGGALVRLGEERVLSAEAAAVILASAKAGGAGAEADGRAGVDRLLALDAGRISVPLALGQRLVGFLAVGPWAADTPNEERIRLLLRLAPHAAAAVENARLHAEVRRLSLTDPLVQLPNRRQLDLFLEREFAAAERGRALCFIIYDLDHFKAYNDTHGHREGDNALIRFAQILQTETRTMNLAARYGGEEFATVLSGTNRLGGKAHAERVRRRVLHEFGGGLTVSAGVAEYRPGMKSPIDLVVAADRALYRAKLDGRNRVYVAQD